MRRDASIAGLVAAAVVVAGSVLALARPCAAEADTQLADAAMKRDMASVRALLDKGAPVNAPGTDGTPALHWAVRVDDLETASLLLKRGADASLPNRYGITP